MNHFELEYELRLKQLKAGFVACKQWQLYTWQQEGGLDGGVDGKTADAGNAASQYAGLQQAYQAQFVQFQSWLRENFHLFDPARVSSLMALPTRALDAEEKIMHRIWMGGALPALVQESIRQWGSALVAQTQVRTHDHTGGQHGYQLLLWVWDSAQLQHDPAFSREGAACHASACNQSDDRYHIGQYRMGSQFLKVNSLHKLAQACWPANLDLIEHLHTQAHYVNLSDIFRLLILRDFGGIYLDADTMPYRPATVFLAKPEVPDFIDYQWDRRSATLQQHPVSWMNLFQDENGLLVAKRQDPALARLCASMHHNLLKLRMGDSCNPCNPGLTPAYVSLRSQSYASALYASSLHDATYGVWQQEIGRSFISHHELMRQHCVLLDEKTEAVLAGLEGMRLVVDAISNQKVPLDADEQAAYQRLRPLLQQGAGYWQNILQLEQVASVFALQEVPRMAYPPQLRSKQAHCHYYSFLSDDPLLDQANGLFARYLMQKNALQIEAGNYWVQTSGMAGRAALAKAQVAQLQSEHQSQHQSQHQSALLFASQPVMHFVPGLALAEPIKERMAKLLFATSYLEYCSVNNKLQLPLVALQRVQNIDPYLAFTHAMFDQARNFIGFFCAATVTEFAAVPAVSHYRDEIKPMDDAYDVFIASHCAADELFVSSLALDEAHKGKGLFHALFAEIALLARRKQCQRITLTVWGRSPAFQVYLKQGFQVRGEFDQAWDKFFDRLYFMEYALSPATAAPDDAPVSHTQQAHADLTVALH